MILTTACWPIWTWCSMKSAGTPAWRRSREPQVHRRAAHAGLARRQDHARRVDLCRPARAGAIAEPLEIGLRSVVQIVTVPSLSSRLFYAFTPPDQQPRLDIVPEATDREIKCAVTPNWGSP